MHAYACVRVCWRVCWHVCLMGQWFAWSIFGHTRLSSPLPPGVKEYGGKKIDTGRKEPLWAMLCMARLKCWAMKSALPAKRWCHSNTKTRLASFSCTSLYTIEPLHADLAGVTLPSVSPKLVFLVHFYILCIQHWSMFCSNFWSVWHALERGGLGGDLGVVLQLS